MLSNRRAALQYAQANTRAPALEEANTLLQIKAVESLFLKNPSVTDGCLVWG